jgi:hypothetical protein
VFVEKATMDKEEQRGIRRAGQGQKGREMEVVTCILRELIPTANATRKRTDSLSLCPCILCCNVFDKCNREISNPATKYALAV